MQIINKIKKILKILNFYRKNIKNFEEIVSISKKIENDSPKPPNLMVDNYWYDNYNFWEPSVLMILKKLVNPGDNLIDVGANFGGLTVAMSRLSGLNGKVAAFEASPRIINYLQHNLVNQGCNNTHLYNFAVTSVSNENIPIYEGNHLNDTIIAHDYLNSKVIAGYVKTITLDYFCFKNNFFPNIVKFDIEGAEFDALVGFEKTISGKKPILILEQSPEDSRCFKFLKKFKYNCINLSNFNLVNNEDDFNKIKPISNLIFFTEENLFEIFPRNKDFKELLILNDKEIAFEKNSLNKVFKFKRGYYLFNLIFSLTEEINEKEININLKNKINNNLIFQYQGSAKIIADSYDELIFLIEEEAEYNLNINFLSKENKIYNNVLKSISIKYSTDKSETKFRNWP